MNGPPVRIWIRTGGLHILLEDRSRIKGRRPG